MHHSQRIKCEDKLPESGTGLAASQIRQPYQACALPSKQDWLGKGPNVVKEDFASSVFKQEEGCGRDIHHHAAHEQMTDKEVDEVEELSRVWLQSDTSEEEEAILRADFHGAYTRCFTSLLPLKLTCCTLSRGPSDCKRRDGLGRASGQGKGRCCAFCWRNL